MERWILVLYHEGPELADLQEEWQKEGIFVRSVSDVGKVTSELLKDMEYLLFIIFSDGQEFLPSLKIIRRLTKVPILVLDRQYNSTKKTFAIKEGGG